jgi:hypothetical protein
MILHQDGRLSIKNTGFQGKLTSVSSKNKEAFASFVYGTLTSLGPDETLQLTIATKPGLYVASFATPATIG